MSRSNTGAAGGTDTGQASGQAATRTDTLHSGAGHIGQQVPEEGVSTPGTASGTESVRRRVRIGSPRGILATVPWLLRFQPSRCIVVIGTEPTRGEIRVTHRYDMPDPGKPRMVTALAAHTISLLDAQGVTNAVLVGYGTDAEVSPVVAAVRERASRAGIAVTEALRAQNGLYWSYICTNPSCCPPDGTPFEAEPASVSDAFAGVTVLESREALAATLEPVDGEGAALMRRAVRAAERDARSLAKRTAGWSRRMAREATARPGLRTVKVVVDLYRAGGAIDSPVEAAKVLEAILRDLMVRDDCWARMQPEHGKAHLRMWTDLTRLAPQGYVAPPASLLAFVAWQLGDGALANVALDRALADAPDYTMARLLRDALDAGAPPSMARLPMTPEQVADAYLAAAEAEDREAEAQAEQDGAEAEAGDEGRRGSSGDARTPEGEAAPASLTTTDTGSASSAS